MAREERLLPIYLLAARARTTVLEYMMMITECD